MRTVLVCALLALVPFTSLRMVCVDAHDTSAGAGAAAAAAAQEEDECVRICTRRAAHHADVAVPEKPSVTCLLVADPTCQFFSTATAAILPREPGLSAPHRAVRLDPPATAGYRVPVLDRRSPPPRAQV